MPSRHTTLPVPEIHMASRILRPDPRWFRVRAIVYVVVALLYYRSVARPGGFGLLFAMGGAFFWLLFKNSSMTLDSVGFTYQLLGKRTTHRWVDVERFCVVTQSAFGLIPINRYLGWNYSPSYKNYKILAIPRAVARWVGMADAMVKPIGFNVKELSSIMNQQLHRSRAGETTNQPPIPS